MGEGGRGAAEEEVGLPTSAAPLSSSPPPPTLTSVHRIETGHTDAVWRLQYSRTTARLYTASWDGTVKWFDPTHLVAGAADGSRASSSQRRGQHCGGAGGGQSVVDMSLTTSSSSSSSSSSSAGGGPDLLLYVERGGNLVQWDPRAAGSGTLLGTLSEVTRVAAHGNHHLLTGHEDGTLSVFDRRRLEGGSSSLLPLFRLHPEQAAPASDGGSPPPPLMAERRRVNCGDRVPRAVVSILFESNLQMTAGYFNGVVATFSMRAQQSCV